MAFTKYADCEVLNFSCSRKGQRTASLAKIGSFEYEPATDGNYLYVAVRACTADVPNLNLDMLPSWELETAYETFRGASVFLNHDNSDPAKARGVVVDAKYHDEDPDDKWVEILMEMDEDRCPKLCSLIRSGEMDTVSMGANLESTTCSICGNVAEYPFQYCTHVQQKGREFDGKVAFEICNGIEFFEESWVYDPADPTAHAMTMMDSDGTFTSEGCDDTGVARWSRAAAFADEPRTPAPVDTKETDKECPACGEDTFDGETCSTCGYTEPPEGMGDIDLDDEDEVEDVDDGDDDSEDGSENMGKKQKRGGSPVVGASGRLLDIYVGNSGGYLYVEATISDQGGNPLTSVELDIDVPEGWGFGDSHDFTERELYDFGIDPNDPYGSQWAIWEYMDSYSPAGYAKSGAMEPEFRFW